MNRQSIHIVQEMIIGAFSHLSRVDDEFIKELIKKVSEEENGKETIAGFWAFSEIADCQKESIVQIRHLQTGPEADERKMKTICSYHVYQSVCLDLQPFLKLPSNVIVFLFL